MSIEYEIANLLYHSGRYQEALVQLGSDSLSIKSSILKAKANIDLDEPHTALEEINKSLLVFAQNGDLNYWQGVCLLQCRANIKLIDLAFTHAENKDSPYAAMGKAFIAYADKKFRLADELVEKVHHDDIEMEHIRCMIGAQVCLDAHWFDKARSHLDKGAETLKLYGSLSRQNWQDVLEVRYLRSLGCFAEGKHLLKHLKTRITKERHPRLWRNYIEAEKLYLSRQRGSNIGLPKDHKILRLANDNGINRKPVLNALLTYLLQAGDLGASKAEIINAIWDETYNPLIHDERFYKSINRLRKLVGDSTQSPKLITQRGEQYVLAQ